MSREIKFRAWVKDSHMMIADWLVWNDRWTFKPSEQGQYIPMQYTGLKDKNGVEIYEGDIIDTHLKSGRYMKVYYNVESVSFNTEGLGDISWVKTGGLGIDMSSYIEVIGNIYENPELLEEHHL